MGSTAGKAPGWAPETYYIEMSLSLFLKLEIRASAAHRMHARAKMAGPSSTGLIPPSVELPAPTLRRPLPSAVAR